VPAAAGSDTPLSLSIVTPVYSGEAYLDSLVREIDKVRNEWEAHQAPIRLTEAVFVDDGAIDDSLAVLSRLRARHDWIRIITLSRNYGTHSATAAGVVASGGDWVATLDEDLQHHPEHIEAMLQIAATRSADIVYAEPISDVHGGSWRDVGSKSSKAILARLASTPQIRQFNSFRLIRGEIARAAAASCTSQTYFDMALTWFTTSVETLPMELKDLRYIEGNQSGFNFSKLASHAKKLMISSRVNVATKGLYAGTVAIVFAVLAGLVVIIQHMFFPDAIRSDGWASLIVLISFFSGVIISILCLALEYVNILLQQQMGQPNYYVISRQSDRLLREWFEGNA